MRSQPQEGGRGGKGGPLCSLQVIPRRGDQCYRVAKQDFPPDETGTRQCPPPAKAPGSGATGASYLCPRRLHRPRQNWGHRHLLRDLAGISVRRSILCSQLIRKRPVNGLVPILQSRGRRHSEPGGERQAVLGVRAGRSRAASFHRPHVAPTEETNEEGPAEQGYSVCFPILRRDSTGQLIAERTEGNRGVSPINGAGGGRGGRVRRPGAVGSLTHDRSAKSLRANSGISNGNRNWC